MSDGWKAFWRGLLAGVLAVLGALLLIRRRLPKVGTPSQIAAEAEAEIEKKRDEIKADSDAALTSRFNTLAKKQEKKG